ncbi:MAG: DUF2029 domain-containing protein [Lachnospiraceae bacterium]|nr:DUF2029 domain-containing protein [Lachnospiraceae bacterium]
MNRFFKTALFTVFILLAAVSVVQGVKNALLFSQDFQYDAALALRSGINPYEESLHPTGALESGATADFYAFFEEKGIPQKMEANQFPSLLMLLFPMTFLPYGISRVLWLFLNLLFTALSIFLLRKTFLKEMDRDIFILLMLLMIAGTPWRNQVGVGQHTLFSLFFFLLAVYLSEKDIRICSGLSLSVSYFKYTLTAPLAVYFIYKKRYREFVISLIPHVVGTFAAAVMLKTSFIDMIREPLEVSKALAGEGSIDIGALSGGASWSLMAAGAIMLGCVLMAVILPEGYDGRFFSLLLLISLVMTYHRSYDFFVLAPAACGTCLLSGDQGDRKDRILTVVYIILTLYIFFGLRVFNESSGSLTAAAFLFYGYLLSYMCLFKCNPEQRKCHPER